ncbi:N-acetylglucosamine-6-phosphate deacetylase [Oscillospiraceae bacterium]|nr:N-acetylglucosamine-6-phosphate deacetylase [Oscillospiraceae bacterium]
MRIPGGFIDTHIHGCFGEDMSDCSIDGLIRMAKLLPKFGVTAFCPTTMTISRDDIYRCFEAFTAAREALENEPLCASLLGIHLEGPLLNPGMAGVQAEMYCMTPSEAMDLPSSLEERFPGVLKIIDIAPELDGGYEFISEYSRDYVISLAHTKADYSVAMRAFECGASSVTHVLNAMGGCGKRDPGILGAVCDRTDIRTEIICDGIHIDPTVLRMLFKVLPEDKIVVVSDSMRGAGMPDGMYRLGSADVMCKGGRTYFGPSGNLAGSVTDMASEASNLFRFGIDTSTIVRACSVNPLKTIGIDDKFLTDTYVEADEEARLVRTVIKGNIYNGVLEL